jgi:uncharacterized phage protein (TIGR01671 family)
MNILINYVLKNDIRFHYKTYSLGEIEQGIDKLFDHWNYTIIAKRIFTGLKDKNGKNIFEGDILNHVPKFETLYEVKWLVGGFYICPIGENYGEYFSSGFAGYDEETKQCNSIEVVGNIYENNK